MSVFKSVVPLDEFSPVNDKIAVMLRSFTIKKRIGVGDNKYSEPYFVTIAIPQNKKFEFKNVEFATKFYPKTRRNAKIEALADGIQIFGPANPGEFLAFCVLVMESDEDVRQAGELLDVTLKSGFADAAFAALGTINPTVALATQLTETLAKLIANQMRKNKDDQIFLTSGTLLRDVMGGKSLPFHINEVMKPCNDFVDLEIQIFPVSSSNKSKKKTFTIK